MISSLIVMVERPVAARNYILINVLVKMIDCFKEWNITVSWKKQSK